MSLLEDTLWNVFSIKSFREGQKEAIEASLQGEDVFVIMPTGGGKSLTYQFTAVYKQKVGIVISPLISLMNDQISHLDAKNIESKALNSSINLKQYNDILEDISSSQPSIKLLYTTPEQLMKSEFQEVLKELDAKKKISVIAIDEAHCISAWGHDFRPSYRKLSIIKKLCQNTSFIVCTATATKNVKEDIKKILKMQNAKEIILSFNRPNLFYTIKHISLLQSSLFEDIFNIVKYYHERGETGIVYCFKKDTCDDLAQKLRSRGFDCASYHAGLPDKKRNSVQLAWIEGKIQVLIATIAFGLGINKADVRFVIHHSLPKSIEGYYQESGRAGRDGLAAECTLYYSNEDFREMQFLINKTSSKADVNSSKFAANAALASLNEMKKFCEENVCRRKRLLKYFGEILCTNTQKNDICCDVCTHKPIYNNKLTNTSFKHINKQFGFSKSDYLIEIEPEMEIEKNENDYQYDNKRKYVKDFTQTSFSSAKDMFINSNKKFQKTQIPTEISKKGFSAVLNELQKQEEKAEKFSDKELTPSQRLLKNWMKR